MIYYRKLRGYKYQLRESDVLVSTDIQGLKLVSPYVELAESGMLWIREGYLWDGPSGPVPDNRKTMFPSIVHDALYQLHRLGLLPMEHRHAVDELFARQCRELGTSRVMAKIYVWGLHRFGEKYARPRPVIPILSTPRV